MIYVKVGIIGCGSIARYRHGPEYAANPYVKQIVFYDRNPERAEKLAEMFKGSTVARVEDLYEDPEILAISDCSSNESHHIFSTRALLSGKHVLCEKPIALTVDDAEKSLEAEKKSGKKLMIGHNQRFTKAHLQVKEIIKNNELGEVLTFKTTFGHEGPENWGVTKSKATWFFQKERSGLGVAGDLGIHKVDLLQFLLEDEIAEVSAFEGALDKLDEKGNPIGVCDNLVSILRTKSGRIGTASFSWTYYGEEDNSTVLYCERGIVKVYHRPDFQVELVRADGGRVLYELEKMQTNVEQTSTGVIDAFIRSIVMDEVPAVTGLEALSSLKVVLAMLEAAESGRVVSLS